MQENKSLVMESLIDHLTGFEHFLGVAPIGDVTKFLTEGVRNGLILRISIETLLRCSLSTTLYSPAFVSYERNNLIPDDGPTYNVGRRCPLHELQRNRGYWCCIGWNQFGPAV